MVFVEEFASLFLGNFLDFTSLHFGEVTSVSENFDERIFVEGLLGSLLEFTNSCDGSSYEFFFRDTFSGDGLEFNLLFFLSLLLNNLFFLDSNGLSQFGLVDDDALV